MKNENKVIIAFSWGSSLRLFPWDDKSQISESQNLISMNGIMQNIENLRKMKSN